MPKSLKLTFTIDGENILVDFEQEDGKQRMTFNFTVDEQEVKLPKSIKDFANNLLCEARLRATQSILNQLENLAQIANMKDELFIEKI